jgi:sec-independent protein translocase protein TatA
MFRNPVTDLIVVVVVALLIFGPKRLPMLGRALGHGLREFKEGITGESKSEEERPALTPAAAAEPVAPPAPAQAEPQPVATSVPAAATPPAASEPESASAEHRS